ncbi:MAG TPA: hypothetical protein VF502_03230 [Stellaceae bacterium]
MITVEDVRKLALARVSPAVSIFLPTHPTSREIRQDPARLKNLAEQAEHRLVERGCRPVAARAIVQPALSLAADAEFWRHGGDVALFLGPDYSRFYRVPAGLREDVAVDKHFSVKELLPLLAENGTFFILAVSAARARLFEATRYGAQEIGGLKLPQGARTVAAETDYQDTVLGHPVSRTPVWPTHQGMGKVSNAGEAPEELRRTELMEYLTRLSSALNDWFSGKRAPVVLAALPDLQGNLRRMLKIERLLSDGLEINPDAHRPEKLHDLAYQQVRPVFAAAEEQALDHFRSLQGSASPKAGTRPAEIVDGARYGRVDTLFLADGAQLWGHVGDKPGDIEVHPTPAPDDEDLLDRAAIETLLHRGTIAVLPKERLPVKGPMAAIFRY